MTGSFLKFMHKVDVIIPTYKPGDKFYKLLCKLKTQTVKIHQIIIINTEKVYFDDFFMKHENVFDEFPNLKVFHIKKREFDHGRTRNFGVKQSKTEFFIMMTDDAVPVEDDMIERLCMALKHENIAVSYARQLPDEDSGYIERYTRRFNYPEQSVIKTEKDVPMLGIKTYFCSNVCAAYNRRIFDELGGFINHTVFNEDMIYAAKAAKAGYGIAYEAEASIIHCHNYSAVEQFHRNFDLGVSQAEHPEVFDGIKSESEGKKLVLSTQKYLLKHFKFGEVVRLYITSAAKFLGYKLGKNYMKLPRKLVIKCAMNKEYFR